MEAKKQTPTVRDYSVFNDISRWFDELDLRNRDDKSGFIDKSNTRATYERHIKEFFNYHCSKDIEYLIENDVIIKKSDLMDYRTYLAKNKNNTNTTINNKIAALKSLIKFLESEHGCDSTVFNFRPLPTEKNPAGSFEGIPEAEEFAEAAFIHERQNRLMKKLYILFSVRTGARKSEVLRVKWEDIAYSSKYDCYLVNFKKTKQKKARPVGISNSFYKELLTLKDEYGNHELIFHKLTVDSINDMWHRVCKVLNIPQERNIRPHSLRNTATNFSYNMSGDIKKVAAFSGHKNINVLNDHYLSNERDYSQDPGVLIDQAKDIDFLDSVTLEQFRQFFLESDVSIQKKLKKFLELK
ncbi:tyrosine-type recombinase/integrase [Bacillus atrophaeus]|uniref:tyrosine-type recombinase/integrase n=2 Tax=Bacillus atrophaeus TaxID=1452 RepID=UPI0022800DA0|nr:tyrosine-type recombinase/integrase [Bacillus atrophaeus]MCY7947650.1 tyrosine-type recombinase/integrase [Bacillus atrophaeus]MCY9167778.1 tyrosine-type recombinase/integrase [Bacillus atrophaeus]MEC0741716.1 tyrosine-type recombinase/integrase [Bacillus atrophaeus]MEC0744969.1 tyrosine-type recombinase/integrase [Bacillus atrophaeus]MEC0757960.1 tyrosine-type recombinase/integrase [Bacillus atrophaeus]